MKPMALLACLMLGLLAAVTRGADEAPTAPTSNFWPDPKLIQELERKKTSFHFHESEVPKYELPDPLRSRDGSKITSREEWEAKGRPETLEQFRKTVYGRSPAPGRVTFNVLETDAKAMEGQATRKRVKITCTSEAGKSFSFQASLLTPNNAAGRVPAFIL